MNRLTASSVLVALVLQCALSVVLANVKITPIAVENKSELKSADLKVEEARYQNPIMPEYYGSGYDRNRNGFVTSYGSNYDRYGSNGGATDRYGGSNSYDSNRYGTRWSERDRIGTSSKLKLMLLLCK